METKEGCLSGVAGVSVALHFTTPPHSTALTTATHRASTTPPTQTPILQSPISQHVPIAECRGLGIGGSGIGRGGTRSKVVGGSLGRAGMRAVDRWSRGRCEMCPSAERVQRRHGHNLVQRRSDSDRVSTIAKQIQPTKRCVHFVCPTACPPLPYTSGTHILCALSAPHAR